MELVNTSTDRRHDRRPLAMDEFERMYEAAQTGPLVAPKTAQMLARHSDIKLTIQIYTHINAQEQADAIKSLPGLTVKKDGEA